MESHPQHTWSLLYLLGDSIHPTRFSACTFILGHPDQSCTYWGQAGWIPGCTGSGEGGQTALESCRYTEPVKQIQLQLFQNPITKLYQSVFDWSGTVLLHLAYKENTDTRTLLVQSFIIKVIMRNLSISRWWVRCAHRFPLHAEKLGCSSFQIHDKYKYNNKYKWIGK